uniref:Uncharacterized protein n=1 Tax=Cacopsylla melanoneura TaxID=428564 RepID=A0A8D9BL31_9HEMI
MRGESRKEGGGEREGEETQGGKRKSDKKRKNGKWLGRVREGEKADKKKFAKIFTQKRLPSRELKIGPRTRRRERIKGEREEEDKKRIGSNRKNKNTKKKQNGKRKSDNRRNHE